VASPAHTQLGRCRPTRSGYSASGTIPMRCGRLRAWNPDHALASVPKARPETRRERPLRCPSPPGTRQRRALFARSVCHICGVASLFCGAV
jgi:hypothetical protein